MRRTLNETPKLLVTGGASDRVEKAIGLPYRAVPDLVLQGLAVSGRASPAADERSCIMRDHVQANFKRY